ncbi:MAG: type II secretion system GspH family protein [Puniceicoccales bacterium]|jgi:prepilin-type N-terminal cleavage/methylation domain-containing protein|nr:type II secretion system GspH family protein [Puniceicoccales bacterium]
MDISKRNGKSGMTLIEILIVVALIGVLATVMVRSLGDSFEQGRRSAAKIFVTDTVPSALQIYKARNPAQAIKADPGLLKTLISAGLIDSDKDPWGQEYAVAQIGTTGLGAISCIFGGAPNTTGATITSATNRAGALADAKTINDTDPASGCVGILDL